MGETCMISTYTSKMKQLQIGDLIAKIPIIQGGMGVGISRSHLFRSFQTYMNCSPKEYLTEYRIQQACRLLKETGLSVSAIAYSVGFENNLYFSKAFRKVKKTSPTEYREKHRKKKE